MREKRGAAGLTWLAGLMLNTWFPPPWAVPRLRPWLLLWEWLADWVALEDAPVLEPAKEPPAAREPRTDRMMRIVIVIVKTAAMLREANISTGDGVGCRWG